MVQFDYTFPNNPIKIGDNAIDNRTIIKEAKFTDYWFHLTKFPSCHVIISVDEEYPINQEMIKHCAYLVKNNTKYKNFKNITVNYTTIKNVYPTDIPGKVIVKHKPNSLKI